MSEWSTWKPFFAPEGLKRIDVSDDPGVYQLKNKVTHELVLFGIGQNLNDRMKSLMPPPYGVGTRNNMRKREYVLKYWADLEFRVFLTNTRKEAARIEKVFRQARNHIFNT